MAVKNTAQVIIGGKIMTLGGYESEEYFQQVAVYMNRKISELGELSGYSRQPMETKHTLLSLNITDDYFKAKKQVEAYELDLQQKDQEMYDLKHELISLRMQIEEAQKKEKDADTEKNLLEGRVKELEEERDALGNGTKDLEAERDTLQSRVKELEDEKNALETRVKELEAERDTFDSKTKELEKELDELLK